MLGFVMILLSGIAVELLLNLDWCELGFCVGVTFSLMCRALWWYWYQSDMPGFVAVLLSVWRARLCGSVSLTCQALWQYCCQSDMPGFVAVLSVWHARLCGSIAVSLTCQALWQYRCQSDVPGFVAVPLSCHVQTYINFGDSHEYV